MPKYSIRVFGDPVLRERASEVTDVTDALVRLADDMVDTMRAAPGLGLAAPQVGVQKRLFVYELPDSDEGPKALVNPVITESSGEWEYEEGCLSIPGLYFPIFRPKEIHITGFDLDGILLLERLDPDTRKQAMKTLREISMGLAPPPPNGTSRL